jgi:hypothetical protein
MSQFKETTIVLLLVGCILLIAPMSEWLFYRGFSVYMAVNLPLYFALPLVVLAMAIYDMKRLYDGKKYVKLRYFALSITVAFAISVLVLLLILPYFKPTIIL